jgi:hypothetical protein
MNNGLNLVVLDQRLNERHVSHAAMLTDHRLTNDTLQAIEHDRGTVGKVVEDDRLKTGLNQRNIGVTANVASAASKKNITHLLFPLKRP